MLSPDNNIQAPGFTQNYNRYSYCLNNPLIYTDPDGEFLNFIIGGIIGGVAGTIAGLNAGAEGWELFGYIAIGTAAGALTSGVSAAATSAGYAGVSAAVAGGAVGGAVTGGGYAALAGENVIGGMMKGMAFGALGGAASYGAMVGMGALGEATNNLIAEAWTGKYYDRFLLNTIQIDAQDGLSLVGGSPGWFSNNIGTMSGLGSVLGSGSLYGASSGGGRLTLGTATPQQVIDATFNLIRSSDYSADLKSIFTNYKTNLNGKYTTFSGHVMVDGKNIPVNLTFNYPMESSFIVKPAYQIQRTYATSGVLAKGNIREGAYSFYQFKTVQRLHNIITLDMPTKYESYILDYLKH